MASRAIRPPWYRAGLAIVATVAGWLALVGAHGLVLPLFGVVSPVTWSTAWIGWLWVIAVPGLLAVRQAFRSARPLAAGLAAMALLAGFLLWQVKPPSLTIEGYFRQHQDELAVLAAEYRAGSIDGPIAFPLWRRPLSIDGRAHPRCGGASPATGHRECALYLPLWQNWRAEAGAGLAYYPVPPGPHASLVTAAGDTGIPVREVGDGWWLID